MRVAVKLLSGVVVFAEAELAPGSNVLDVKREIEQKEGTPVRKQQLIHGAEILADDTEMESLTGNTTEDVLELTLVRKEGVSFTWELEPKELEAWDECVASPGFKLAGAEMSAGKGCTLAGHYYPKGLESPLLKDGFCSLLFSTKPHAEVLQVRVTVPGRGVWQHLFANAQQGGTVGGWTNFLNPPVDPQEFKMHIDVLFCGCLPQPSPIDPPETAGTSACALSWDLRVVFAGLAVSAGRNFSRCISLPDTETGENIDLRLTFFPGGHQCADGACTSLRVLPVKGLGDRRYQCNVDGTLQTASGESLLHFPRPERYGNIQLVILPSREATQGSQPAQAPSTTISAEPAPPTSATEDPEGEPRVNAVRQRAGRASVLAQLRARASAA